jgi:riboflavin kinase/FMN adenylyltransferase
LRHIRGSAALEQPIRRTIVTIGNFDGIHLGHQAILKTVVGRAADLEGQAVVYTFDPHPRKVLRPEKAPPLLTTLEQKLELLEQAGVDAVVVEPFTPEFSRTGADEFVRILHERIQPLEVYVGYDFHFGRDREGSMRMLTEVGPRLGFSVTIIPEVTVDAGDVNSTRIRQLLAEGEAESAARMLGRPFTIRGYVVRGDERGRTLGFPTANVEPENEVVPAAGVYAGHLHLLDEGDPAAGTRLGWSSLSAVGCAPSSASRVRTR